ncbi:hypothetical protein AMAG_10251 [Allomyces macrogynus ATCC 38327]|uniref:Uncharacterized protein n=1 Tax=Allomyces macrogynus (strain ATCC 38327) TaxID=578462 RepID=A0A0L0STX6_ALLM3|nr:hypothetical protein AMAG_10251 [Allomyces macrogynus ATCC 38327]|eukprot:KNE65967.1 hypothetical protein AMAG_10251 [Allomyces macrogynus ATCC 38327]
MLLDWMHRPDRDFVRMLFSASNTEFVASLAEEDPREKVFVRGKTFVPKGADATQVKDKDHGPAHSMHALSAHNKRTLTIPEYQPEAPVTSNPLKKRKLNELMEQMKRSVASSDRKQWSSSKSHYDFGLF